MFATLMYHWERIAQLIYDALLPHLPRELVTVLALMWPMFVALLVLAAMSAWFTWKDRRDLNRRLNRRLSQLRDDLDA